MPLAGIGKRFYTNVNVNLGEGVKYAVMLQHWMQFYKTFIERTGIEGRPI